MIKLTIKIPKRKRFKLKPRQIDEAAQILVDDLQQTVPYDTGTLYRGIRRRKTANGVEIYIKGKRNNEVAGYLIEDTKRHFVKPVKKKALAWFDGGRTRFSRGHFVKGIKKGYWKFQPRKRALNKFTKRLMTFIKAA